jgi:hypothetical protein
MRYDRIDDRILYHVERLMRRELAVIAVCVLLAATATGAASLPRTATATATVNALAKLTLSGAPLAFAGADPDTVPNIPASGGPLTITAKCRTTLGSTVLLSVIASSDLRSGLDVIPVSQLSWTGAGAGFASGTMSTSASQTVGTWTSSGSWIGTQTYALVNSWSYSTGTYTTTLTYTLSAP